MGYFANLTIVLTPAGDHYDARFEDANTNDQFTLASITHKEFEGLTNNVVSFSFIEQNLPYWRANIRTYMHREGYDFVESSFGYRLEINADE